MGNNYKAVDPCVRYVSPVLIHSKDKQYKHGSIHSSWQCVNSLVLPLVYFCLLLNSFASLSVIVADSFYPQISESHSLNRNISKSEANGLSNVSQGHYCLKERPRMRTRAAAPTFEVSFISRSSSDAEQCT